MEIEKIVAANLTELRKSKDWTQQELAERINYSDKTVSKWERGDGLPDLRTTVQLAALFGVTVDFFLTENAMEHVEKYKVRREEKGYHICISLLFILCMWIALTVAYAYILANRGSGPWMLFVWGVPLSCVLMLFMERRFFRGAYKKLILPIDTVLCWTALTALYLQFLQYNIWPLFLVGIPVQIAVVLWAYVNRKYRT